MRPGRRWSWLRPERWLPPLGAAVALGTWEWQVRSGGLSPLFFPAPSAIARTFVDLFATGELPAHVGTTLFRVVLGFALGGGSGLILGLAMGWLPRLRAGVDPFVAAAHPVPKIAILPLIMIVFGIGELSKVVVVAIAAFFPMLINTMDAVRQINPTYFEVARNLRARPTKVFSRVLVPGSLPLVLTGARLAFNLSLLLAIAVELVAGQKGLGAMIWLAWQTLRTRELYVAIGVTAGLGVGSNALLQCLATHLVPWQATREA